MIEVRNLSYLYSGGRGLQDLSLTVPSGESCSIIGPSGCGKTTLVHLIAGLIEIPDRYLSRYSSIIVDEAHERSLNIDFILGLLKQIIEERPGKNLTNSVTSSTVSM